MPVVLSDQDAASVKSHLVVLLASYELMQHSEYRDFEIRMVRRLIDRLHQQHQPAAGFIRAVK